MQAFSLVQAGESERIERDRLTYAAWGSELLFDQYLQRESNLRTEAWPKRALTTWILQNEQGEPLASCETYEMLSYLRPAGKTGSRVDQKTSLAIASVYTEPRLRGNGYATDLILKLIQEVSRKENQLHSIVLYSEIGDRFYQKMGFVPVLSEEWVVPPRRGPQHPLHVEYLKPSDLQALSSYFFQPPDVEFCIWPELDQVLWHYSRQNIYANFLKRETPAEIGATIGKSFILWMADYKYNVLRTLLMHTEEAHEGEVLLQVASAYATSLGLREVRSWVTEKENYPFARRESRRDAIAMIHPLVSLIDSHSWKCITRSIWV
jgi:GNAT superfamily N-acetyltransferase